MLRASWHSLEQELRKSSSDADLRDSTGISRPWQPAPAAQGNETAVLTLLSYEVHQNNTDEKLDTPSTFDENQNHEICVRLPLETGALLGLTLLEWVKLSTPLDCAAGNATEPILTKPSTFFNADIWGFGSSENALSAGCLVFLQLLLGDGNSFSARRLGQGFNETNS